MRKTRAIFNQGTIRAIVTGVALTLLLSRAYGQDKSVARTLYDPIFWRDRLKLSSTQQRKINEINATFYEHLKQKMEKQPDSRSIILQEELARRQSEIEKTFHPRQRRKWEKLASQYI